MIKTPLSEITNSNIGVLVLSCKKNEDKTYHVIFDGGYEADFSGEEVVKYDLFAENEETRLRLDELISEINRQRAFTVAYTKAYASLKPEKQLVNELSLQGFSMAAAEYALGRLRDEDMVNDRKYAEKYAAGKASQGGKASGQILRELVAKGIDYEVAAAAVEDAGCDDYAAAKKLALKRASEGIQKEKILRYLYGKGFSSGIVARVGEELDCFEN